MAKKFYSDRNSKVVKRRVDDAGRRLENLESSQVRKPPKELIFQGLETGGSPASEGLISLREVSVDGRLAPVTVHVSAGQKLLVEGANGSGKSTLLAVLAGTLKPSTGQVQVNGRFGLLAQDPAIPDLGQTAEEIYRTRVGEERAETVPLSAFGLLHPRDLARPAGVLSTGQLRRLDLAIVLANPPDILALDEPTNHLSLDLATAIESQLPDYPGIVVVATHDRWLRRVWGETGLQVLHLGDAPYD